MSTTTTIVLVGTSCILIAFYLVLQSYTRFWKSELERLDHLQDWREKFFEAAKPLISDDEMPVDILQLLKKSARNIDHPRSARVFYDDLDSLTHSKHEEHAGVDWVALNRKELMPPLMMALTSWIMAVSFNDAKVGPKIRERFAEFLAEPKKDIVVWKSVAAVAREPIFEDQIDCLQPAA